MVPTTGVRKLNRNENARVAGTFGGPSAKRPVPLERQAPSSMGAQDTSSKRINSKNFIKNFNKFADIQVKTWVGFFKRR